MDLIRFEHFYNKGLVEFNFEDNGLWTTQELEQAYLWLLREDPADVYVSHAIFEEIRYRAMLVLNANEFPIPKIVEFQQWVPGWLERRFLRYLRQK